MSLPGKYMAKDICVSKNERFVSYRTGETKTGHDGLLSRCSNSFPASKLFAQDRLRLNPIQSFSISH